MNLQEKLNAIIEQMEALNQSAIDESREFTSEEQEKYTALEAEANVVQGQIERAARLGATRAAAQIPAQTVAGAQPIYHAPADPAKKEFESMAQFLSSVHHNPNDQRLTGLYTEMNPTADGSMGEGKSFGFLIPKQFSQNLYKVSEQDNVIRARATVIPAGSPPDAEFSMPALNQGAGSNMFGGVQVNWTAEGVTVPKTDINTREVSWKPNEVLGVYRTTEKSLRNFAAAATLIEERFRAAVLAAEDTAFFRGNGVNKPQGIITAPAAMKHNRAGANSVSYTDIVGMEGKIRLSQREKYVWFITPALQGQLRQMRNPTTAGGNGELIFTPSAADGMPPYLLGYPVIWYERASEVGKFGDISLLDVSEYYIKDGSGPFVRSDGGLSGNNFDESKVSFKIMWNVDGRPALDAPYVLENGQTVSPFVTLDVPA